MMRTHADLLCRSFGEDLGIRQFRKHAGWYLTGFAVGPVVRRSLGQAGSLDEVVGLLGGLDPTPALPPGGAAHGPRPHQRAEAGPASRRVAGRRWTIPLPRPAATSWPRGAEPRVRIPRPRCGRLRTVDHTRSPASIRGRAPVVT